MYKQPAVLGIRFATANGQITVERLIKSSKAFVGSVIKDLNSQIKESTNDDALSFMDEATINVDPVLELKFNIAKDIYMDKLTAEKKSATDREIKKHNDRIDGLILARRNKDEGELSIEELEKLRK